MTDARQQVIALTAKINMLLRQVDGHVAEMQRILAAAGGPTPEHFIKDTLAAFDVGWQQLYTPDHLKNTKAGRYPFVGVRHAAAVKRLHTQFGVEETRRRIGKYLCSRVRFYVETKHSFDAFLRDVHRFGDTKEVIPSTGRKPRIVGGAAPEAGKFAQLTADAGTVQVRLDTRQRDPVSALPQPRRARRGDDLPGLQGSESDSVGEPDPGPDAA